MMLCLSGIGPLIIPEDVLEEKLNNDHKENHDAEDQNSAPYLRSRVKRIYRQWERRTKKYF